MSTGHHHHHGPSQSTPLRALSAALAVTGVVFVAELVGGWLSGSMALMADAMHMLSDAAGLIIAVVAVMAGRRQATAQATYGYRRIEVLAALVNAVTVIVISVFIVIEALRRLKAPADVDASTMLVIAVIGLLANALSALILSRHREASVNVEGAFLHVVVDMLGSVAVIAAAVVIRVTGFRAADVVASLVIAVLVIPRAWQLLSNSAKVLLEQVPHGFDVERVEPALRALDGVVGVHDLHLWSLDGSHVLATVHLVVSDAADAGGLLDDAQHALRNLGVDHSTIQLERPEHVGHERIC
ncbi:cation diffusion facilitator family transporter [Corynebacterium sp. Q4381]|uniref:cation diffusion facilitator family transporter n=1 Tax=Corynebacterium sp. Marseille-Q4381 TaxID=3121597 RepID=UPI002FE6BCBF